MLLAALLIVFGLIALALASVWQRKEQAFWRELDSSFAIDSVTWLQEELLAESTSRHAGEIPTTAELNHL